jgi:tetratricopeptide (TPR) repeat protein
MRLEDSGKLRQELVRKAFQAGQWRPAQLKLLKDVPPGTVTDRDFYWERATTYCIVNQFALALPDYNEAIRKGSPNATLYYNRGCVEIVLGHYQDALNDLNSALDMDWKAGKPAAYFHRALVYDKLGKADLAAKDRQTLKELGGFVSDSGANKPAGSAK